MVESHDEVEAQASHRRAVFAAISRRRAIVTEEARFSIGMGAAVYGTVVGAAAAAWVLDAFGIRHEVGGLLTAVAVGLPIAFGHWLLVDRMLVVDHSLPHEARRLIRESERAESPLP